MSEPSTTVLEDSGPTVFTRCLAKSIDLCVVLFLNSILSNVVGALLGFIYMLIHDGLFSGQSLGKRVFKLKSVSVHTRLPCGYRESAIRNAPIGIATFFAIIPFWGWILAIIVGIPVVVLEIYLMATRDKGQRLGDVMADTEIVSLK